MSMRFRPLGLPLVLEALAHRWELRPTDVAVAVIVVSVALGASLLLLAEAAAAMSEVLRLAGHSLGIAGNVLAASWRWLPLPLVVVECLAVFLLGGAAGVAFAQGSHSASGRVDFVLARLYDDLSERGWRDLAARIPPATREVAREAARALGVLQRRNAAVQSGRREALEAAHRLREPLPANAPPDPARLQVADRIDVALGVRRMVATLPTVRDALVTGRRETLELHFAPVPSPVPTATVQPPRHNAESGAGRVLQLFLFANGAQVETTRLQVLLPPEGSSTSASTSIVATSGTQCSLDIYVTGADSTEVLQTLHLQLPVASQD